MVIYGLHHWGSLAGGRFWWDFDISENNNPENQKNLVGKNSFSGFFQVNAICFYTGGRYLLV